MTSISPTPQTRQSTGWTAERRAKHSLAIRRWSPWTKSTGPRTAEGKEISKMNAWKHGQYCRQAYQFRSALRDYGLFLRSLLQKKKGMIVFQRNELLKAHKENQGKKHVFNHISPRMPNWSRI